MKTLIVIGILTFSFPCIAEKYVEVDLKNFKFKAYENGKVVREGLASGGRRWCPDIKRGCKTPQGQFVVLSKKGRFYRSPVYPLGCNNKSKNIKEKCAAMAFAVKFHYSGAAFHSSNDNWNKLHHQSHSCIHLQMHNAKWLNEWINIGDKVIILKY